MILPRITDYTPISFGKVGNPTPVLNLTAQASLQFKIFLDKNYAKLNLVIENVVVPSYQKILMNVLIYRTHSFNEIRNNNGGLHRTDGSFPKDPSMHGFWGKASDGFLGNGFYFRSFTS